MEQDGMSTATMTSVTEDLSLDESDTSSRDINTSSQITTSDGAAEGNATVIHHTPSLHASVKREDPELTDVSMEEGGVQDEIDSTIPAPVPQYTPSLPPVPQYTPSLPPDPQYTPCLPPSYIMARGPQNFDSSKQPSENAFQIPDLTSLQGRWYEHECFNHYWRHYHFVTMWCQKHMQTYKTVLERYNNTVSQSQQATNHQTSTNIHPSTEPFKRPMVCKKTLRNRKARRRRKVTKRAMKKAMKERQLAESCTPLSQTSESDQKDEEGEATESAEEEEEVGVKDEEMEITDEMLDFFAQSHKHKQERDALKKSKNAKEEKRVNIEEGGEKERTETAPVERPGSRRTSEMLLLYGKGAAMIHGMETAMQMTFDRNLDVLQPRLWPNMPLRIIF